MTQNGLDTLEVVAGTKTLSFSIDQFLSIKPADASGNYGFKITINDKDAAIEYVASL